MNKIVYDKIVQDEQKLRRKSSFVHKKDDVDYMIKHLNDACDFYKNAAYAVAGIQLDIDKQIFVTQNVGEDRKIYLNPTLIKIEKPFIFDGENCLSFPNRKPVNTQRFDKIIFEYYDREFNKQKEEIEGNIKTVVIQHELDHLNGILYFDHIQKPVRKENNIGRNDPCICGSGKKYKKCCLYK